MTDPTELTAREVIAHVIWRENDERPGASLDWHLQQADAVLAALAAARFELLSPLPKEDQPTETRHVFYNGDHIGEADPSDSNTI